MAINSRQKGCRGEREFRDFLNKNDFNSRRGQQYSGGNESPDVVCKELDGLIHFEVKRVERLNIHEAVEQAQKDCPQGKWRVVAHKKNRKDWLITMPADDWIDLIKEYMERS